MQPGREGGSAGSCTCSPVRATRGKALRREWELAVHSALPASKRSSRGRGHACRQVELGSCLPHGMAVCMAALQLEGCSIDQHQCTHSDPALLQQNKPRRHGCSDSGTLAFTQPPSLVLGCPRTRQTSPRWCCWMSVLNSRAVQSFNRRPAGHCMGRLTSSRCQNQRPTLWGRCQVGYLWMMCWEEGWLWDGCPNPTMWHICKISD